MKHNTGVRVLVITIAVIITLGAVLLVIANRFWFEHPEEMPSQPKPFTIAVLPSPLLTRPPNVTDMPGASSPSPVPELSPEPTPVPTPCVTGGELLEVYDDDGISLSLHRFVSGEGQQTVTYYVTEAILDNASQIKTGLAKDTFGRNYQEPPSSIARRLGALFAVNGDYYGFREDGIVIRNGVLYRDLPAEREGAAILADGRMIVYNEMDMTSDELLGQNTLHSFSFGPILVNNGQRIDKFYVPSAGLNPRTAIGMIEPGHFVFIVVDGRLKGYSQGMTLKELAALMESFGCETAYNLDGGGTSTMVWDGLLANKPLGKDHERASSDILYIK